MPFKLIDEEEHLAKARAKKELQFMPVEEAAHRLVEAEHMDNVEDARELVIAIRVRGYVSQDERKEKLREPRSNPLDHDLKRVPLSQTHIAYDPRYEEWVVNEALGLKNDGASPADWEMVDSLPHPTHVNYEWILDRLKASPYETPALLLEMYRHEFLTLREAFTILCEKNGKVLETFCKEMYRALKNEENATTLVSIIVNQEFYLDADGNDKFWHLLPQEFACSDIALKEYTVSAWGLFRLFNEMQRKPKEQTAAGTIPAKTEPEPKPDPLVPEWEKWMFPKAVGEEPAMGPTKKKRAEGGGRKHAFWRAPVEKAVDKLKKLNEDVGWESVLKAMDGNPVFIRFDGETETVYFKDPITNEEHSIGLKRFKEVLSVILKDGDIG